MARSGRVDGATSPQQFQPEVPSYSKSKLAVGVVALVTIAAVGCLIAHFTGAHVPKWMQSHKFQLALEIGSPLGAAFSIFTSILITQAKQRSIDSQRNEFTISESTRVKAEYQNRVKACHPAPTTFESKDVNKTDDVFEAEQTATAEPMPGMIDIKDSDKSLALFSSRTALIKCTHSKSFDSLKSFSCTIDSSAYYQSLSIDQMTVDVYAPGKHASGSKITRTIYKQFEKRRPFLGFGSNDKKNVAMADAIQACTEGLKSPHVVFVHFGETLFVRVPSGVRVNLVSRIADNYELREAGIYQFPIQDLSDAGVAFVTGDSEFTKTATNEGVAGLYQEHKWLTSQVLLNAALGKRTPDSNDLNFNREVKPMSCMVYRVRSRN